MRKKSHNYEIVCHYHETVIIIQKNWECHYENISNNLDPKTLCDSNNYEKNLAIVSHNEILSHYYQTVIIMRKKISLLWDSMS